MSSTEPGALRPVPGGSLTSIPGIRVGHWTDEVARTGCTVVALPEPNATTCEIRGSAPGTRETALLAPGMTVQQADAVVLTGGSAFGLASADGVMRELEREGRGFKAKAGVVPIVAAAVLFDLGVGDPTIRPGPDQGAEAYRAATDGPVADGALGAGTGATAAKWRGVQVPAGLGSAAFEVDGAVVAALVAVNALGDAFSLEGRPLTGGPHVPAPFRPPAEDDDGPGGAGENTTLAVVATDAALDRTALTRLALRAQDAYAACLRPAHTGADGDAVFAVSAGAVEPAFLDNLAEAAFAAVGRAIEAAVAAGGGG